MIDILLSQKTGKGTLTGSYCSVKSRASREHISPVLIRRREVERLTTLSRSRIYALMAQDAFPKSVSLGPMSVAWIESEVREWIAARITEFRKSSEG